MAQNTSPDYTEVIAFLEERGPIWQERMGLDHIEIAHHYLDAASSLLLGAGVKNKPGTARCSFGSMDLSYTAFVETRWNYQLADVYFMSPALVTWSQERQEQILVHEYCHILLAVEQYLLDDRLGELAAEEAMTTTDLDLVAKLYYERLEMATENVCRAIWRAWA
jgi:hypothetical protein